MAAHQAPPSLGFSRQEYWSGLPFPSPMHESEKWKWSRSVMSDPQRPHGLQPSRLLRPWDFLGKSTGVGCHCLLRGRATGLQNLQDWVYSNLFILFTPDWESYKNLQTLLYQILNRKMFSDSPSPLKFIVLPHLLVKVHFSPKFCSEAQRLTPLQSSSPGKWG